MKFIRQFGIILFVSFLGEAIKYLLPLPIPASIYGLVIMLLCLKFKIIKLSSVKETGEFLVNIMPLMFIPAGVGLMVSYEFIKNILIPVIFITIITTVIVMGFTGKITQLVIEKEKRWKK